MDKIKTAEIVKAFARKEGDTGSPEVQIALLTERINQLTAHLENHLQDNHSRRGMLMLVSQRNSMLKYLENKDVNRLRDLKKTLKIR